MAYFPPTKKPVQDAPAAAEPLQKIRITLTSRNVSALEKVCAALIDGAVKHKLSHRGPVRMPTRTITITTRKSPCGNGTNTWDLFEMRIHKRIIDLHSPAEKVKTITNIEIAPDVDVDVVVHDPTD